MNNLPHGILRCVQRLCHLPSAGGWVLFDQSQHILLKLRCSSWTWTTRITFWHLTKGKHCKESTLLYYSIYWCTCNKHKLLCYVHTWNFPASLSRLSMAANEEWFGVGVCLFGKRSAYNRAAALPLQSALPYANTMSVISAVVYWYMSNAVNNLTALDGNKTYLIQTEGIAHAQECYYGHIDS